MTRGKLKPTKDMIEETKPKSDMPSPEVGYPALLGVSRLALERAMSALEHEVRSIKECRHLESDDLMGVSMRRRPGSRRARKHQACAGSGAANDFGVYLGTKNYDYMKWDGPKVSAAAAQRHYLACTAPDGATRARCLIGASGLSAKDQKRIRLVPAKQP